MVKVPCSGDFEVSDSIVLVVEDFEHVGSDGSPVFGDPRYISCNPAVKTALQRPAPPSPSKREKTENSPSPFDYSFTQSLDPSDLLFLETTCTQTLHRQSQSFPQVISDQDWRIPPDQIKLLERIELIKLAAYEYSDVELSEEESVEEAVDEKEDGSSPKRPRDKDEADVAFPLTQYEPDVWTQTPITQIPITQVPMTEMQMIQEPVPSESTELSPTQHSYSSLLFPETQVPASSASAFLDNSPQTPVRIRLSPSKTTPFAKDVIRTTIESMNQIPSSPINSPVKPTNSTPSPSKQTSAPPTVIEYPDYSAW